MQAQLSEALRLDEACPESVFDELRKIPLGEITKGLGPSLCKETTVEVAMRILARATTDREMLQDDAVKMVCVFFAEKSQYRNLLVSALSCLSAVARDRKSRCELCGPHTFRALFSSPFMAIKAQSLPLGSRRHFFDVLSYALTSVTASLLDEQQLQTILDAVDGESDPQLVLCTFQIHEVLARNAAPVPFASVAQEYFESLSSYFPIVFARPPGCVVTKKELRDALAAAMKLEAYKDYCIPFLFGKLASPSFSVKDDTLDTLRQCLAVYSEDTFKEFASEVVTQLRNEVLKLVAYADHDTGNPALSKQMETCCEVMRVVSQRYADLRASKSDILKVFEPITEGLLASCCTASRVSQTCAAYATMMFHTLTGGWLACLYVGPYTLTMLTLTVHDVVTPETAILISAVCSGMMDALSATNTSSAAQAKVELHEALQQTVPALVQCGKQAAAAIQTVRNGIPEGATDEEGGLGCSVPAPPTDKAVVATLCLAECVASVIKLSAALDSLISDEDATQLARSLAVAARTHDATVTGAQLANLFCGCLAVPNSRVCLGVLRDLVTLPQRPDAGNSQPSAHATLQFLRRVGNASSEAAELVLMEGLLCESCPWVAGGDNTVTSADIASAALAVLASSDEPHCDTTVTRFLSTPRLVKDPTFFECACHVYAKASAELCSRRVAQLPDGVPLLETAALVSSRVDTVLPSEIAQTVAHALLAVCAPHGVEFIVPALNGVTGLVRGGAVIACANPPGVTQQLLEIAVLWGELLRDGVEPDLAAAPSLFLQNTEADEEATLSALTYFPYLASRITVRTHSLLLWFVNAGVAAHVDTRPFFWKGLATLLARELPSTVEMCLPSLIPLCERAAGHVDDVLLSRVMMCAAQRTDSAASLARAVLRSRPMRAALVSGVTAASMETRCESLQFLGSLASMVTAPPPPNADGAPVTADDMKAARKDILHAAQSALSDHKRLVRQAAAQCRKEWFKARTQ